MRKYLKGVNPQPDAEGQPLAGASRFSSWLPRIPSFSSPWNRDSGSESSQEQLYTFTSDFYSDGAGNGQQRRGPIPAFAVFDSSSEHNWISQKYAEQVLGISNFTPVPPETRDTELNIAIGQLDLCWACYKLSRYQQMATFYVAPHAGVDVIFGQTNDSIQRKSWKKAINKGTMEVFKPAICAESPRSWWANTGEHDETTPFSDVSFEQGIMNGTLVPVDDKLMVGEEEDLRPSIADLEKHYREEVSPNNVEDAAQSVDTLQTDIQTSRQDCLQVQEASTILEPRNSLKTRRRDFGDEPENKRRRSGLIDSPDAVAAVSQVSDSQNIEHTMDTSQRDHKLISDTANPGDSQEAALDGTLPKHPCIRRRNSETFLDQKPPPSPPRRRQASSRSKHRKSREKISMDPPTTSHRVSRSYDASAFLQASHDITWALRPDTRIERLGDDLFPEQVAYTLDQPSRTHLSKRQSMPTIPRSQEIDGNQLSSKFRARAMSIPGIVVEMDSEERDTSVPHHPVERTNSNPTSGDITGIFKSCIDYFRGVDWGNEFENNFSLLSSQLELAQMRLTRWGATLGCQYPELELHLQDCNEEHLETIYCLLQQIEKVFQAASQYTKDLSQEQSQILNSETEMEKATPCIRSVQLAMRRINEARIKPRRRDRSNWALYKRSTFDELINNLSPLLNNLEELFPIKRDILKELCRAEVETIGTDDLSTLRALSADDEILLAILTAEIRRPGYKHKGISIEGDGVQIKGVDDARSYPYSKVSRRRDMVKNIGNNVGNFKDAYIFDAASATVQAEALQVTEAK